MSPTTLLIVAAALWLVACVAAAVYGPRALDRLALWWVARRRAAAKARAALLRPALVEVREVAVERPQAVPVPLGAEGAMGQAELEEHGTRTEELRPLRRRR